MKLKATQAEYVFHGTHDERELKRLKTIEQVFDPSSRRRLLAAGLQAGWRCLEVGPGAGSIMNWLGEIVGPAGKILAVDINPRFVENTGSPNVEVIRADIRTVQLEKEFFDLVHVRFVLIHMADYQTAFKHMLECLRPGGWIVVEEPDFSSLRAIAGLEEDCASVTKVNQAIFRMLSSLGMDYALGVKLPSLFQQHGLKQLSVDNETPLSCGGSGMARIMKMSALQLSEKYLGT